MTSRIYIFTLLSLLLAACDPCGRLDCITDNFYGQFRVVDKTDGKDLVFGRDKKYDKTKFGFYSVAGFDTVFYEYQTIRFPGTGYDSILHVYFYPQTTLPVYMRFSDGDIDTMNLNYNSYKTKCCGDITEIQSFRYNNDLEISGTDGTQALRK